MDEQRLQDAYSILREVFQSYRHISYETFRHKHLDNPDIDPDIYILNDYEAGTIQGTTAFMRYPLSVDGRTLFVDHPCDVAVSPACRGRHIFTRIQLQGIEHCRDSDISMLFATPNENSYPGYTKLGFLELGRLETYCAVLRPVHLARRKFLRRTAPLSAFRPASFSSREGEWALSLRCPFTEDDLALINARPGVHLRRSLDFYRWKVDYLPEERTAYLCLRRNGRLTAFLVLLRHSNGSCEVCDWMLPDSPAESGPILRRARRRLRPFCDLLSVSMVNPAGNEPSLLASGGFVRKKAWPQPFMIYPTAELDAETLSRLKHFRSWTLRYIDTDTILHG